MQSDVRVIVLPACVPLDLRDEVQEASLDTAVYAESQTVLKGPGGVQTILLRYDPRRVANLNMTDRAYPAVLAEAYGAGILIFLVPAFGIEDAWPVGRAWVVRDHINLLGDNPLIGPSRPDAGPRFLDLSEAYNARLREGAIAKCRSRGLDVGDCVYLGVADLSPFARHALTKLRQSGPIVCGPWLVPEVIAARQRGRNVLAFACTSGAQLGEVHERPGGREWAEALGRLARLVVSGSWR